MGLVYKVLNKCNIAVVVKLRDDVLDEYKIIIDDLDENYNIKFIKNSQDIPHITLCIGKIDYSDLGSIIDNLDKILSNFKTFTITTNGLGLFLSEQDNLFIRWKKNKCLMSLKESLEINLKTLWIEDLEYNTTSHWIAKTSLAYEDMSTLNLGYINRCKYKFLKENMLVKEISIVKFEVNKKEEELMNFVLA